LCKIAKFAADKFLDVDLYEESFNVHGITLNFFIYSKYIRDQICHFFWYFADFAKRSEQSDRPIKIYVYPPLSSVETSRFIGDEVCLHSSLLHPEVFFNVYKAGNILRVFTTPDRVAFLDIMKQEAVCFTPEDFSGQTFYSVSSIIFPIINEFFAQRKLYFIHSASLSKNGQGILFVAPSGGGKSTASLSLVKAGYKLLSDDINLLDTRNTQLLLKAFPRNIRILPETLLMFPELAHLSKRIQPGQKKISIHPEDLCKSATALSVKPRFIIFFDDTEDKEGNYAVISFEEALESLVANALFIMGKYAFSRRLFALIDMLKGAKAYRIRSRPDIKKFPGLIDEIINE